MLLLVETIFDTLNARAAFFAIQNIFDQRGISPLPYGAKVEARKKSCSDSRVGHLHSSRQQSWRDRPDGRGVLEFHFQRAAFERRHELRARAEGIASAHRGTFRHRADLRQRVSERRPAESAVADRFSRNAGNARAAIARVGAERLAQHRRRLLRHDAAAHQGDCRSGQRFAAAKSSDG